MKAEHKIKDEDKMCKEEPVPKLNQGTNNE